MYLFRPVQFHQRLIVTFCNGSFLNIFFKRNLSLYFSALEADEFMNCKKAHEVQAMSEVVAALAQHCRVNQVRTEELLLLILLKEVYVYELYYTNTCPLPYY